MPHNYPATYRHPLPNGWYYDMVRVRPGVFVMGWNRQHQGHSQQHLKTKYDV